MCFRILFLVLNLMLNGIRQCCCSIFKQQQQQDNNNNQNIGNEEDNNDDENLILFHEEEENNVKKKKEKKNQKKKKKQRKAASSSSSKQRKIKHDDPNIDDSNDDIIEIIDRGLESPLLAGVDFHDAKENNNIPKQEVDENEDDESDAFSDCHSSYKEGYHGYTAMTDNDDDNESCASSSSSSLSSSSSISSGKQTTTTPQEEEEHTSAMVDEIALYINGKCVYSNGTAAFVPPGERVAVPPTNYVKFCKGNIDKAKSMWSKTQQWRKDQSIWDIHSRPHNHFHKIKTAYPHYIHGRSRIGHYPIVYEHPGRMNLKHLFRTGQTVDDMLNHYAYFMEFLRNRIVFANSNNTTTTTTTTTAADNNKSNEEEEGDKEDKFGIMVVMDVTGASMSLLSGDVLKYLKKSGDTNTKHYPLSLKRVFVINAPFWLAGVWSTLRGIMPETVPVEILSSSAYGSKLREYMDEVEIPTEYGGLSPYGLGYHPMELELVDLVESMNSSTV